MRFGASSLILSTVVLPSVGHARPSYESAAPIAYMVDLSSGAVLYDKQSTKKIPPASMAKMMTAYVVFDLVAAGKLKLEEKFTVTPETWKKWHGLGSTMYLNANEKVSISDLLHGLDTLSGNDAAIVLAEGVSGSEAKFTGLMNATAKRLGMNDSHFGTANGWPDEGRTKTTARDLALLGQRTIRDFPKLYRTFYGQPTFRWNNVTQPNRDPLLGIIKGADGMKTGHTAEAGYCFTGTALQGGRRLMMVVAGLPSFAARISESRRFMQWGFHEWRLLPVAKSKSIVADIPVQLGSKTHVSLMAPRDLALTLPLEGASFYKLSVRYKGPIKAPFKRGADLAELVAQFEDGTEQAMPLIAAHSVNEAGFFGRALNGLKSLVGA